MNASWRPSWATEQRAPAFMSDEQLDGPYTSVIPFGKLKHLWGNIPALDVLRFSENEGAGFNNDCCLLFAGTYHMPIDVVPHVYHLLIRSQHLVTLGTW